MVNYNRIFTGAIDELVQEGRYREFLSISKKIGKPFSASSKSLDNDVTLWCTNDYLGMSQNPKVIKAAIDTVLDVGVGSGGTRNIGGTNEMIENLEGEIADLHKREAALVFTSGYVANDTTLSTLAKLMPDCIFFSDEYNHASIIEGIKRSGVKKYVFRHNDVNHLEELLQKSPCDCLKIIVFESAYSMDGTISPMEKICDLAEKYNAITYLDEVHTVGLYGEEGSGMANVFGVDKKITIIQGTLAKAYGTIGGYISGQKNIIDAIRSYAPGFIFTTSLPPMVAAAAPTSIRHLRYSDYERNLLKQNVLITKKLLKQHKINFLDNDSHIIPVMIKDPVKAQQASAKLLKEFSIYIQHINYPTVPRGTERLRIIPNPFHDEEMINNLVKSLKIVLSSLMVEETAA